MIYVVTINNKKYEVEVEQGEASLVKTTEITQNNSSLKTIQAPVQAPTPAPTVNEVSSAEGQLVKAPMPGTILDIKVSVGTKVKKGDVVFILEAMKMENEIVAPVDGVVVQIIATKGSSVSTGDTLGVIQ